MTIRHAQIGAAVCAAHLLAAASALGNNIKVSNVTLTKNTGSSTATVQFDVAWENSWRVTTGPSNYDAAWVFVKFHTGDLNWKSAALDVSNAAHTATASIAAEGGTPEIKVGKNSDASTRGMGVFIQRSATGSGNVTWRNVKLKWNYTDDAVTDSSLVTLDVHAIEMVYIPQGSFQVGDGIARTGAADVASFVTAATPAGATPYTVANANQVTVGPTPAGSLTVTGLAAGNYKAIPTTFPNGFNPYYIMKYEGSQQQWASFYNTTSKLGALTYTYFESTTNVNQNPDQIDVINARQDFNSPDLPPHLNAFYTTPVPANGIALPAVPTRPLVQAKFPDRAFISSEANTLAYLDWAGLRPMTEFEYEKAARGTVAPVQGEFAWGTADIALLNYGAPAAGQLTLSEDGTPAESPANNYNTQGGNAWTRPTQLTLTTGVAILGPARVGMFAKSSYEPGAPPRIQSGAGFYGVMDLTGNVSELVAKWTFPLATSTTATFVAEHGDGQLLATANHNVAGWALTPAGATFYGLRGGSFFDQPVPVSARSLLVGGTSTNVGIRGVRTAP